MEKGPGLESFCYNNPNPNVNLPLPILLYVLSPLSSFYPMAVKENLRICHSVVIIDSGLCNSFLSLTMKLRGWTLNSGSDINRTRK